VELAWQNGLIDGKQYGVLRERADAWLVERQKEEELMAAAGENPEVASFLQGLGRGSAGLAGAIGGAQVGAAAGALTGPAAPVAVPVLGALGAIGGGIAGAKGYDKIYEELAERLPDYEAALAAKDLKPGYYSAGELTAVGVTLPVSAVQAGRAVATALSGQQAGQVGKMMATAGGMGAATGAVGAVAHSAVEGEPITPGAVAQGAGMGLLFGGFFLGDRRVTTKEIARIAARGQTGAK
jgi:hypothetical protein